MVFQIGFAAGLLALLVLVPLVIIYLRRPKALSYAIPSIMFFSEHKGRIRSSMLFRKFIRNILFIIQFLALGLLAFSCSQPSFTTERFAFLDDTVLVLDTSASMRPVFESMRSQARRSIAAETSIVLAGAPARTVLESGTADRALTVINELAPTDRSADLNAAVLQAIALADAQSSSARIVLVTDRRSELSSSLIDLAEQKGHAVSIIDVSEPVGPNVGIVDASVHARDVDVTLRNFDDAARNVTLAGAGRSYEIGLEPRGLRRVSLPIGEGEYEFSIVGSDGYAFDDTLYVSNTARTSLSALIVTTSEERLPIERALRAMNDTNISITKNRLGTITRSYDLIVMSDYATRIILPSFYTDARALVENGAVLVIGKNERAGTVPDQVMPVVVQGSLSGDYAVQGQSGSLTQAVEFTDTSDPLDTYPRNGSITVATAGTSDLITVLPIGSGAAIYYGYDDSDPFSNTPSYPIFWSNVIEGLSGADAVSGFNVQAGDVRRLRSPARISTPAGSVYDDRIDFSLAGFYEVADTTFAANVLSEDESDPSYVFEPRSGTSSDGQEVAVDVDLVPILALLALVLILTEFIVIKRRGEI